MAKKKVVTKDQYRVVSGIDTSDEKRFEADEIVTADDLLDLDFEAFLEMGAIVPAAAAAEDDSE